MALDVISLAFCVAGAISWVVALGGVAAVTAIDGMSQSSTALAWWAVWWQFGLLIFAAMVSMGSLTCVRLRTNMFLMVTVVWMLVAWDSNKALDAGTKHNSRVGCELAGAILILIVNMCQIIYYGLTEDGTEPLQCGRRANPDSAAPTTPPPAVGFDSPKPSIPESKPASPV